MKHLTSLTRSLTAVPMVCCFMACGNASGGANSTGDSVPTESFHANNDIAMTVRSLVDATSLGERLDPLEYNYAGVLTDGSGRPIYTDTSGAPGVWSVEVDSPSEATITNTYPGDLLGNDLRLYLLHHLDVKDDSAVVIPAPDTNPDMEIRQYPLEGAVLTFEQTVMPTQQGTLSEQVTIRIASASSEQSEPISTMQ